MSTRLEPNSRWNEIRAGNTVDNFNLAGSTERNPNVLIILLYFCVFRDFIANDVKMCYIMTLGVLASYRHMGYGAEILEKIILDSKNMGIKCIGLHVHIENRNALKFYDRRGFKVLGKVDDYYKKISPNSAYILELKLE